MNLNYPQKKTIEDILELSRQNNGYNSTDFDVDGEIFYGDNFDVLSKLINSPHKGKVDLIYIDPPFCTGNDFVVGGGRTSTISRPKNGKIAYSDKFDEEDYLEFMRERLVLLREMLSQQGSIYLHIDTKIGHYVKIIMDEIFGRNNFLNDITRRKSNPKNFTRKAYGNEKDVIYFYAKNNGKHIWNDIKENYCESDLIKRFAKVDEKGRRYTTVPIHAPGESSGETGGIWKGMHPPNGRHWRVPPKELDKLDAKGLIEWSKTGNPRLKKFADEHKGKKIQDIWLNFKDSQYPEYPSQKNIFILELIIKQSSNEGSLVMDAFAGSGNFLLAAKQLNRQFIGIDKSPMAIELMKEKLRGR